MIAAFNETAKTITLQCNDMEWEAIESLNRVYGSVYVGNEITKWCEARDAQRHKLRSNKLLSWFQGLDDAAQTSFMDTYSIDFGD